MAHTMLKQKNTQNEIKQETKISTIIFQNILAENNRKTTTQMM